MTFCHAATALSYKNRSVTKVSLRLLAQRDFGDGTAVFARLGNFYPFKDPIMIPPTKYFCKNG